MRAEWEFGSTSAASLNYGHVAICGVGHRGSLSEVHPLRLFDLAVAIDAKRVIAPHDYGGLAALIALRRRVRRLCHCANV